MADHEVKTLKWELKSYKIRYENKKRSNKSKDKTIAIMEGTLSKLKSVVNSIPYYL